MARASVRLIAALRETAARLEQADTVYRWSQLAHCNCGHLTQTITGLAPHAIHEAAARHRGDWAEQARSAAAVPGPTGASGLGSPDYGSRPAIDEGAWEPEDLGMCPVAELSMTQIFGELSAYGLDSSDIGAFERLDDPVVRRRLGTSTSDFLHSDRRNVIVYARAWADVLEERLFRDGPEPMGSNGHGNMLRDADADDALPIAAE